MLKCLELLNLLASGILAGGEFMVCAGLRGPLASLGQIPHIDLRKALILRLRILTPIVFFVALLTGAVVAFQTPKESPVFVFRCAGEIFLLLFIATALLGTVPINKNVLTWNPANPPTNWLWLIRRWELLDVFRCVLAMMAFTLLAWSTIWG